MALFDPSTDQLAYQVTLTLKVSDVAALWAAAAQRGLSVPGSTPADVYDVIGPREDPALAECIAMLTAPAAMAGCVLDEFDVDQL